MNEEDYSSVIELDGSCKQRKLFNLGYSSVTWVLDEESVQISSIKDQKFGLNSLIVDKRQGERLKWEKGYFYNSFKNWKALVRIGKFTC